MKVHPTPGQGCSCVRCIEPLPEVGSVLLSAGKRAAYEASRRIWREAHPIAGFGAGDHGTVAN